MNRQLSMLQTTGILLLLFAVWIGGWTLAITAPQFAALQKTGIQKTARVNQKFPYRSKCTGRSCTKPYVLQVRFFSGEDGSEVWDLGPVSIQVPKIAPGELIFAELEVSQAVYDPIQADDPIQIVFFKQNPEQVWPAETVLRWRPWTNYLISGLLGLGGVGLSFWRRRLPEANHD
jgi:hypothetical protein